MGVLDFKAESNGAYWNYTKPERDDFRISIEGTVVRVTTPPKRKFGSQEIERWKNGDVVLNICLTLKDDDGNEVNWEFGPGSAKNRTNAMACLEKAIQEYTGEEAKSVLQLLGMKVKVATKQPPEGFEFSRNNPRPFGMKVMGQGKWPYEEYEEVDRKTGEVANVTKPVDAPELQEAINKAKAARQQESADQVPLSVYEDEDIPF